MTTFRWGWVGFGAALLGWLNAGCGATTSKSQQAPDSVPDELEDVPCTAWAPGNADWSSLPGPRPAVLAGLRASASGRYLYGVGSWREAGTSRQQLLRSRDLGETWCVVETPADISMLAPSPASEKVLYALTAPPSGEGPRLLRTSDGGVTWESGAMLPEVVTGELAASASDAQTVWFVESNYGPNYNQLRTLYYSQDRGESWATFHPPAVEPDDWPGTITIGSSFTVDPAVSTRLFAWSRISTSAIHVSTDVVRRSYSSEDAGASWVELEEALININDLSSATVFTDIEGQLFAIAGSTLQRSADWGVSWTEPSQLPADQLNVGTLGSAEAGHLFAWRGRGASGQEGGSTLWRSVDNGAHWQVVALPADLLLQPAVAPASNTIVGLTARGVASTTNAGRAWHEEAANPLPIHLAGPVARGSELWATDALGFDAAPGLRSPDGGLTWSPVAEVVGDLLLDSSSSDVAFAGVKYASPTIQRTEDGGKTWVKIDLPLAAAAAAAATCRDGSSCLYVTLTRNTPQGPACSIIESEDRGRTWSAELSISPELCGELTLQVMPDDPRHLLNGCGPAVCESKDGGATWSKRPVSAQRYVGAIVALSGGVALAATNPIGSPDIEESPVVVRSEDGGTTWTKVSNVGASRFFVSAVAPSTVFLKSPVSNAPEALYRSDDAGLTWQLIANGGDATPAIKIFEIADGPGDGFIATTLQGLVQFR